MAEKPSGLVVVVRVRGADITNENEEERLISVDNNSVLLSDNKRSTVYSSRHCSRRFSFDQCFDARATQEQIYSSVGCDALRSFQSLKHHTAIIAYGQTGSGKTFTMVGTDVNHGLIPRICHSIQEATQQGENYRCSFYEIYNERVIDLLDSETRQRRVREHPKNGPYVENLTSVSLSSEEIVEGIIRKARDLRSTSATQIHHASSRSHAVLQIYRPGAQRLYLVDLAGSEKPHAGDSKDQVRETAHINKSLATLGNVILSLSARRHLKLGAQTSKFIPYRNSVLTWLLKDSLGGRSKTIMIGTISSSPGCYAETLKTLRYAHRARNIFSMSGMGANPDRRMSASCHDDALSDQLRLITELRQEIDRLQGSLCHANVNEQPSSSSTSQLSCQCATDENGQPSVRRLSVPTLSRSCMTSPLPAPLSSSLESTTTTSNQSSNTSQADAAETALAVLRQVELLQQQRIDCVQELQQFKSQQEQAQNAEAKALKERVEQLEHQILNLVQQYSQTQNNTSQTDSALQAIVIQNTMADPDTVETEQNQSTEDILLTNHYDALDDFKQPMDQSTSSISHDFVPPVPTLSLSYQEHLTLPLNVLNEASDSHSEDESSSSAFSGILKAHEQIEQEQFEDQNRFEESFLRNRRISDTDDMFFNKSSSFISAALEDDAEHKEVGFGTHDLLHANAELDPRLTQSFAAGETAPNPPVHLQQSQPESSMRKRRLRLDLDSLVGRLLQSDRYAKVDRPKFAFLRKRESLNATNEMTNNLIGNDQSINQSINDTTVTDELVSAQEASASYFVRFDPIGQSQTTTARSSLRSNHSVDDSARTSIVSNSAATLKAESLRQQIRERAERQRYRHDSNSSGGSSPAPHPESSPLDKAVFKRKQRNAAQRLMQQTAQAQNPLTLLKMDSYEGVGESDEDCQPPSSNEEERHADWLQDDEKRDSGISGLHGSRAESRLTNTELMEFSDTQARLQAESADSLLSGGSVTQPSEEITDTSAIVPRNIERDTGSVNQPINANVIVDHQTHHIPDVTEVHPDDISVTTVNSDQALLDEGSPSHHAQVVARVDQNDWEDIETNFSNLRFGTDPVVLKFDEIGTEKSPTPDWAGHSSKEDTFAHHSNNHSRSSNYTDLSRNIWTNQFEDLSVSGSESLPGSSATFTVASDPKMDNSEPVLTKYTVIPAQAKQEITTVVSDTSSNISPFGRTTVTNRTITTTVKHGQVRNSNEKMVRSTSKIREYFPNGPSFPSVSVGSNSPEHHGQRPPSSNQDHGHVNSRLEYQELPTTKWNEAVPENKGDNPDFQGDNPDYQGYEDQTSDDDLPSEMTRLSGNSDLISSYNRTNAKKTKGLANLYEILGNRTYQEDESEDEDVLNVTMIDGVPENISITPKSMTPRDVPVSPNQSITPNQSIHPNEGITLHNIDDTNLDDPSFEEAERRYRLSLSKAFSLDLSWDSERVNVPIRKCYTLPDLTTATHPLSAMEFYTLIGFQIQSPSETVESNSERGSNRMKANGFLVERPHFETQDTFSDIRPISNQNTSDQDTFEDDYAEIESIQEDARRKAVKWGDSYGQSLELGPSLPLGASASPLRPIIKSPRRTMAEANTQTESLYATVDRSRQAPPRESPQSRVSSQPPTPSRVTPVSPSSTSSWVSVQRYNVRQLFNDLQMLLDERKRVDQCLKQYKSAELKFLSENAYRNQQHYRTTLHRNRSNLDTRISEVLWRLSETTLEGLAPSEKHWLLAQVCSHSQSSSPRSPTPRMSQPQSSTCMYAVSQPFAQPSTSVVNNGAAGKSSMHSNKSLTDPNWFDTTAVARFNERLVGLRREVVLTSNSPYKMTSLKRTTDWVNNEI